MSDTNTDNTPFGETTLGGCLGCSTVILSLSVLVAVVAALIYVWPK